MAKDMSPLEVLLRTWLDESPSPAYQRLLEAAQAGPPGDRLHSLACEILGGDASSFVRCRAVQLLATSRYPLATGIDDHLLAACEDADPGVRLAVLYLAEGKIMGRDPARGIPFLRMAMIDPDCSIRRRAVDGLERLGIDRAAQFLPDLVRLLDDKEAYVRKAVVSKLHWLGDDARDAVPALVMAFLGWAVGERRHALQTLLDLDPDGRLIGSLLAADPQRQEEMLAALREIGEPARGLRRVLQDAWGATGTPHVSATEAARPQPDGPDDDKSLWWAGESYPLEPQPYQLLLELWGKDRVEIATVGQSVWENTRVRQTALKSALGRLKAAFHHLEIPFYYGIDRGYIRKKPAKRK